MCAVVQTPQNPSNIQMKMENPCQLQHRHVMNSMSIRKNQQHYRNILSNVPTTIMDVSHKLMVRIQQNFVITHYKYEDIKHNIYTKTNKNLSHCVHLGGIKYIEDLFYFLYQHRYIYYNENILLVFVQMSYIIILKSYMVMGAICNGLGHVFI